MTGRLIVGLLPAPLFNMNNPPATVRAKIQRTKQKKEWRDSVYYMALSMARWQQWPRPMEPSNVQVTLGVPDRRKRDPHNYEPTVKPILDGLVQAGFWPDDDPRYVQSLPVKLSVEGKGWYSIEITPMEES